MHNWWDEIKIDESVNMNSINKSDDYGFVLMQDMFPHFSDNEEVGYNIILITAWMTNIISMKRF